jgi:hypothetical protein
MIMCLVNVAHVQAKVRLNNQIELNAKIVINRRRLMKKKKKKKMMSIE